MYMYIYIYVHTYLYIYKYANTYIYIYSWICKYINIYIKIETNIYIYNMYVQYIGYESKPQDPLYLAGSCPLFENRSTQFFHASFWIPSCSPIPHGKRTPWLIGPSLGTTRFPRTKGTVCDFQVEEAAPETSKGWKICFFCINI